MAKKKSGSSAQGSAVKKKRKGILDDDEEIDFSDLPELTDEQLTSSRRVGRPLFGNWPRQVIAIRIDPEVLDRIRDLAADAGKGYQTLINEILASYVKKRPA